jgi:flagellar hook-associated protein 2
LGALNTTATLASARFNTAVSSGTFEINGVSFTIDAATDTVAGLLNQINQSSAGVIASYDSVNDRFTPTNKTTGDLGIALAAGTSNFLSAAKLTSSSGGALVNGQDAVFTVNGGASLTSRTNTIKNESHGIEGLTVTALTTGSVTVNVSNDTSPLKQAITDFIDQYNKVQSLISVQTASSTDAKGVVTAGLLASDPQVTESSRKLRSLVALDASELGSGLKRLESLGYKTDGYSNTISLANPGALESALANSLSDVQALFGDSTSGIASRIGNYLESLVGPDGSMVRHRDAVASQSAKIDEQLGTMERAVLASQETLFESFRRMEQTLAQINRQAAFFNQRFGVT